MLGTNRAFYFQKIGNFNGTWTELNVPKNYRSPISKVLKLNSNKLSFKPCLKSN